MRWTFRGTALLTHEISHSLTISSARVLFYFLFGQDGTEAFDSISAVVVGNDDSIVLAGYSCGNWSGISVGRADFAAVRLDADGNELWRWQVLQLECSVLAAKISIPISRLDSQLIAEATVRPSPLMRVLSVNRSPYTFGGSIPKSA